MAFFIRSSYLSWIHYNIDNHCCDIYKLAAYSKFFEKRKQQERELPEVLHFSRGFLMFTSVAVSPVSFSTSSQCRVAQSDIKVAKRAGLKGQKIVNFSPVTLFIYMYTPFSLSFLFILLLSSFVR